MTLDPKVFAASVFVLGLVACSDDPFPSLLLTDTGRTSERDSDDASSETPADARSPDASSDTPADTPPGTDAAEPPDTEPAGGRAPGEACSCDAHCAGSASNPGLCVNGICMQAASEQCASDGSSSECGAGLRCWGSICYPDCDSFACDGDCDSDGSCVFADGSTCDDSCSELCESPHNGQPCPDNAHLEDGGCVCDIGFVPDAAGAACVAAGSGDCPPNSHDGGDGSCYCDEGYVVDDTGTACVRECEGSGDCTEGLVCVDNACVEPPCTADSCPAGMVCADSGSCVADVGGVPTGPVPTCGAIPGWSCVGTESTCGALQQFLPEEGPGYWNYPLNGETAANQYRSFCRVDLMMLVKYAAAKVDCLARDWAFGNGEPLGLGDMSEADGSIPGTSIGSPAHPVGTHVDGYDMDIAYYQLGAADNRLRPICEHTSGGVDQYHCVSAPSSLDVWRTALFVALLHDTPQLRVIGVDGQAGPLIESAISQLCDTGWYSGPACRSLSLAYETTDTGRGWFYFHHHHLHVSLSTRARAGLLQGEPMPGALRRLPVGGCGHAHPKGREGVRAGNVLR